MDNNFTFTLNVEHFVAIAGIVLGLILGVFLKRLLLPPVRKEARKILDLMSRNEVKQVYNYEYDLFKDGSPVLTFDAWRKQIRIPSLTDAHEPNITQRFNHRERAAFFSKVKEVQNAQAVQEQKQLQAGIEKHMGSLS